MMRTFTFRKLALLPCLMLLTGLGAAQPIGLMPNLSPEMQRVRDEQTQLAQQQDVDIRRIDRGRLMASGMNGLSVPLEFRDLVILDQYDMEQVIERLGPYYAFTGAESLILLEAGPGMGSIDYRYRELIDGIETPQTIRIFVDPGSHKITSIGGNLISDNDIDRVPALSEHEAIAAVLAHIAQGGSKTNPDDKLNPADYQVDGRHYAEVVYVSAGEDNALQPSWRVHIERRVQRLNRRHDSFPVHPDGTVGTYRIMMR